MSDAGDTSANSAESTEDGSDWIGRDDQTMRDRQDREDRKARQAEDAAGPNRGITASGRTGKWLIRIGAFATATVASVIGLMAGCTNRVPDQSPVDYLRNDDGCAVDRNGNVIDGAGLTAEQCRQLENRGRIDGLGETEITRTSIPELPAGAPRNSWSDPGRAVDPSPGIGLEISI